MNTPGSAFSAFIALLSPASCWKATALLAMLAFDAAFDAASRKALAFDAKTMNAEALFAIDASASGCAASADMAAE